MKGSYGAHSAAAVALALALGGCSTWQHMDRSEKGTAVGATGGAIVGAAVGGPVGAAVGAGVGGYAGHYETQPGGLASGNGAGARYGERHGSGTRYSENSDEIRSVQQALNDQGYDVGPVDGQMGPDTEDALRRFQQAQNLPQTGQPDARTLAALGVSNQGASQASNRSSEYPAANQAPNRSSESQAASQASNPSRRKQDEASNESAPQPRGMASSGRAAALDTGGSDEIRSVQQALNDKGYDAGAVDGVMGPHTEHALRQFQQAQSLRQTGRPDPRTLAALGVSNRASNVASNLPGEAPSQASNGSTPANESSQPNPPNESNSTTQGSNQASNQQQ